MLYYYFSVCIPHKYMIENVFNLSSYSAVPFILPSVMVEQGNAKRCIGTMSDKEIRGFRLKGTNPAN